MISAAMTHIRSQDTQMTGSTGMYSMSVLLKDKGYVRTCNAIQA